MCFAESFPNSDRVRGAYDTMVLVLVCFFGLFSCVQLDLGFVAHRVSAARHPVQSNP